MKKGIIVLFIAVLAASFAFADFSGDAYIQFNADLGEKDYGFAPGYDVDFTFEYTSESIAITGEEDIHIEVAASVELLLTTDYASLYGVGINDWTPTAIADSEEYGYFANGIVFDVSKARIAGNNW